MKAGIHPAYNEIKVTCACGHAFQTRSTHKGESRGNLRAVPSVLYRSQKLIDTEGRVDRFQKKYANVTTTRKKGNEARPVNA